MKINIPALHAKHDILISAWQKDNNQDALETILDDYQPLFAKAIAEVMRGRTLSDEHRKDLQQECKAAAINAINQFDRGQGTKLTTFLFMHVKGALRRYVLDFRAPCRLGTSSNERKAYYAAQRMRQTFIAQGKETLTASDIQDVAKNAGVSEKIATRAVMSMNATPTALDSVVDQVVEPDHTENTIEMDARLKAMAMFEKAKAQLPARTADIVTTSFLSHHTDNVIARLADQYDLTPRRVRQIQKEGLLQLKAIFEEEGLDAECLF